LSLWLCIGLGVAGRLTVFSVWLVVLGLCFCSVGRGLRSRLV